MRNRRIWISTAIMLFSMFFFVSCENSIVESEASNDEVIEINIAHGNQPTEPIGMLAERWKELVEERSNGEIKLTIYPSSQLGSEMDVVEQAKGGNNVVILTAYDYLMDYVPDIGILSAPYLTDDFDSLLKLTTTDWFADVEEKLNDKGLRIVNSNTIYGVRHLMTVNPVETPNDLEGMKIRVPNNQLYIKTFEAFGASPTPMPLSDTYTGLQQGLIDGAENPLPVLNGSKTNEVTKHLALTEHIKIIAPWVAGTSFIDTLPEEAVDILEETGLEAAEYGREITEKADEKILSDFEAQGVEIHEVDLESFKEESETVYNSIPKWTDDLYETVKLLIEEDEKNRTEK